MTGAAGALERYRAVVDGLAEAVSVWDDSGALVMANRAFWRITGRDPTAGPVTLDGPGWTVLDPSGAPMPPDRWPASIALREGRAVVAEFGLVRPAGDTVWLRARAEPMRGACGRREALVLVEDVTVEREAVAAVRAGRDHLRALIDGIPYPVLLRDREGRYLAVNRAVAEWVGVPVERIEGRLPGEALPASWSEAAEVARARMEAVAEPITEEFTDASGRVWTVLRTPYRGRDGALAGMVVMAVDITEHRALETELMEANAGLERRVRERTAELERAASELEAFTYRVSHDLQGPLRAIRALVGEVAAESGPGAPAGLERIVEGVDRMSSLIGALLDLSHAGRRAVALERVRAGLGAVAAEAAAEVAPAAAGRDVRIEIGPLPEWECDPRLLRLALVNLLSNAVKFSRPPGGRVTVRADRGEGGALALEVADDGVGFNPGEAERLFAPFERLSNARGVEGAGVGLAIVQRIVAAHGGTVTASGSPGGGARFRIEMPPPEG